MREPTRDSRDRDPRDRERDSVREPLPLPPLSRSVPNYTSDVRLGDLNEPIRDRSPKPAVSSYAADLARPLRSDLVGTTTDGIQNARIDQLETAVRTLTSELSNERNIVSSVVQDLQRNLKVERDDTSRFRGGLHDRLEQRQSIRDLFRRVYSRLIR